MAIYAIIVAAGKSRRMGEGINKLLLPLRGKTVIENTMDLFSLDPRFTATIVVTSDSHIESLARQRGCLVVPGGKQRQDSVISGLNILKDEDYVFIHDGARPFLTAELLDACFAMAREKKSFILATPINDTLKTVENGKVKRTLPREDHVLVQTPQGSCVAKLKKAYNTVKELGAIVSDDASALEFIGEKVYVIEGSEANRKITSPQDMRYLK